MYGPLPFSLDFFTEMVDLTPLLRYLENGGEIIPGDLPVLILIHISSTKEQWDEIIPVC